MILLFYSEGKYSVGTEDVLVLLEHIFPNTYPGIKLMALPPAPLTFIQGQRMTAEPSVVGGEVLFPTPPN